MSHIRLEPDPHSHPEPERDISGNELYIDSPSHNRTHAGPARLRDKVALITGGDTGIGCAVALLFAHEGADVALMYPPEEHENAQGVRDAAAKQGRRVILLPGDVNDYAFCRHATKRTVRELGRLDILVNHATYRHRGHFDESNVEEWNAAFKTTLYGYFYMVKAALPYLDEGACILNTGAVSDPEGKSGLFDCSRGQGAIASFTRSLANNLVSRGIRVNCVAPGPESMSSPVQPDARPGSSSVHPGRLAPAEEIAPVYLFFASPADSIHITGEVLTALGPRVRAA